MSSIQPLDQAALSVKVEAIDSDLREVKDSILGLDAKIEKAVTDLAREVRSAIASLSTQFTERQRTPWGVIFTGMGVAVTMIAIVGQLSLNPVLADIKTLKDQIVPREEINFRSEVSNRRFSALEGLAETLGKRRYDEMQNELRELRNELRELKRSH